MEQDKMQGVFPILLTPFHQDFSLDFESLRSLVEFNILAGVHGLGIALGSEIFMLSEFERKKVTSTVVDQVNGRVPVIVNSSAPGTDLTILYSKIAEENGADGLLIMPPSIIPINPIEMLRYYRTVSSKVSIPIFIQDTSASHLPAEIALKISEDCDQVQYIKVESTPVVRNVADMATIAGKKLVVFGGAGGTYIIEELRRGSQGTMPFSSQPEAFVEVWNLYQQGNEKAAKDVFTHKILPINRLVEQTNGIFYSVHKEILRRRGVIQVAEVRRPSSVMDDRTFFELRTLIDELYP